jgi:hypothetical protein
MIINQPRGDMLGWDEYDDNPIEVEDAVKLAGGAFVNNNSIGDRATGQAKPVDYSWQSPIRNIYAPNKASEYSVGEPGRNYGYGGIYANPDLQQEIARVSSETDVPGRWIADSLALVTRGTFSPFNDAGGGAFGYVVKRPDQVMKLGVNPLLYSRGDLRTQMDAVVQQLKRSGVASEGSEYALTSLLDTETAQRTYDNPRLATALNNGVYNLESLWNSLGSHQDIAYNHSLNKRRQAGNSHKHDSFNPECAWCLALAQSKSSIVPHEFQNAYNF